MKVKEILISPTPEDLMFEELNLKINELFILKDDDYLLNEGLFDFFGKLKTQASEFLAAIKEVYNTSNSKTSQSLLKPIYEKELKDLNNNLLNFPDKLVKDLVNKMLVHFKITNLNQPTGGVSLARDYGRKLLILKCIKFAVIAIKILIGYLIAQNYGTELTEFVTQLFGNNSVLWGLLAFILANNLDDIKDIGVEAYKFVKDVYKVCKRRIEFKNMKNKKDLERVKNAQTDIY